MKEFKDNYEPIKVKIYDIEGNEHEVESKFMTTDQYNVLEKMNKDNDICNTDLAIETMIKSCGKDREFWGKFSLNLLLEVSKYITTESNKKKQKNGSAK
jgi:hypothetical protein